MRLFVSMLAIQASIGALNDLVDAPLDAGRKPGKPIPRGLVSKRGAGLLAGVSGVVGVALSAPSGLTTTVAAAVALGLGYAYDLRLSRGPLSWLPLSLALPIVPIHAWLGATDTVPPGLLTLVPAAGLAGFALALGNGLVDAERDRASGRRGIVVALGAHRAWLVHTGALGAVVVLALLLAPTIPDPLGAGALAGLRSAGLPLGIGAIGLGAVVLLARSARVRERGWELEAVGVAAAGVAWLAGTAASVSV